MFEATYAFSDSIARRMALLSAAAYVEGYAPSSELNFPNSACNVPRVELIGSFDAPYDSAYAYMFLDHDDKMIVTSFEGTADFQDVETDLMSIEIYDTECRLPVPQNNGSTTFSLGYIHTGICEYYLSLVSVGLPEAIADTAGAYPKYDVMMTGHSLGGATATLAAAHVVLQYGIEKSRLILYSFGAPRPGDSGFTELVEESVGSPYRVVHSFDVVPHLAPCCLGWFTCSTDQMCPYHAAIEVWYDNLMEEGDGFTVCENSTEDKSCNKGLDLSVYDHNHYYEIGFGSYCNIQTSNESLNSNGSKDVPDASPTLNIFKLVKNFLMTKNED
mmetsp:Transcript_11000/g.15636  ORF Transcript_11000/g.15636 Transcript_11000/m.15636 type:complete len:330 (-) Transcript_11000:13-1002(-)